MDNLLANDFWTLVDGSLVTRDDQFKKKLSRVAVEDFFSILGSKAAQTA